MLSNDSRTVKIKRNIFALIIRKGVGGILSYVLVPLLIDYLDPLRYGVWLTIISVVGWLSLFDIGLGNGMQNSLAKAFAEGNLLLGKKIVSTTYLLMSIIAITLALIIYFVMPLVNWSWVFNINDKLVFDVTLAVVITIIFIITQLVVRLIGVVFTADERPAIPGYFNTIGSIIALITIFIVKDFYTGSLSLLAFIMGFSNILPPIFATIFYFRKDYYIIKPSLSSVDWRLAPSLLNTGGKFFVMQLSSLIIYTTDNLIIVQMFSPAEVPPYALSAQYLGFVTIVFGIILTPFWASFTQAHTKGEKEWIVMTISNLKKLWFIVVAVSIILLFVSPFVYSIWLGEKVHITFSLTCLMTCHVVVFNYGQIFAKYLNGVGKLQIQFYLSILSAIINIPVSIFLAGAIKLGINGVILGTILTNLSIVLISSYQYRLLINGKAYGLWAK